jgi:hypothetical protein
VIGAVMASPAIRPEFAENTFETDSQAFRGCDRFFGRASFRQPVIVVGGLLCLGSVLRPALLLIEYRGAASGTPATLS